MKDCPFCAEPVEEGAPKCAHCGEALVEREAATNERPTAVTIFAVLNGVAGLFTVAMLGLQLLQSFIMMGALLSQGGTTGPGVVGSMLFSIGMSLGIYGLASGCLIASAVGLWRLRPWAHKLSVGCSVLAAILTLLGVAGMITAMVFAAPRGSEREIVLFVAVASALFGGAFLVYWIAQAVVLTRPKIAAAFSTLR